MRPLPAVESERVRRTRAFGLTTPGWPPRGPAWGATWPGAAGPADRQRIGALFEQAVKDRSKTFELKRELDPLGAFKEYEDRFVDLFKKPG